MLKIIPIALLQGILMCSGQIVLKIALNRLPSFAWTRHFWYQVLIDWPLALSGLLWGAAALLWMYMVKNFPFGTIYPMLSLSYVFGILAAIFIFHEEVSPIKWTGVFLIMIGCILITK